MTNDIINLESIKMIETNDFNSENKETYYKFIKMIYEGVKWRIDYGFNSYEFKINWISFPVTIFDFANFTDDENITDKYLLSFFDYLRKNGFYVDYHISYEKPLPYSTASYKEINFRIAW